MKASARPLFLPFVSEGIGVRHVRSNVRTSMFRDIALAMIDGARDIVPFPSVRWMASRLGVRMQTRK